MASLRALALGCTLKKSPAASSSDLIAGKILTALADHDVRFGVSTDEGDGDAWPQIRAQILAADILVMATPIWMGQPSSVCKMVLERLDAELSETDEQGRLSTYGKVAIPAAGGTYWVGEAMQKTDYDQAGPKPDTTGAATKTLAANAAHLARLLKNSQYPPSYTLAPTPAMAHGMGRRPVPTARPRYGAR